MPSDSNRTRKIRWGLHVLFVILILAGIAMKRLADRPEYLPPFHIAALMTLVGVSLTHERGKGRAPVEGEDIEEEPEDMRWDEV